MAQRRPTLSNIYETPATQQVQQATRGLTLSAVLLLTMGLLSGANASGLVDVETSGDADASFLAVSGSGNARSNTTAISGTGDAVSECTGLCITAAISGDGNASCYQTWDNGCASASGTKDAKGNYAVTGTGNASQSGYCSIYSVGPHTLNVLVDKTCYQVSVTGNSTGRNAVAPMQDAESTCNPYSYDIGLGVECLAVSIVGSSSGEKAISLTGRATAVCHPPVSIEDQLLNCFAISLLGPSSGRMAVSICRGITIQDGELWAGEQDLCW